MMTSQAPQILDSDQFQAAVKAAGGRFAQIKAKHPTLKGYAVLCIPGRQTSIWSSPAEIISGLSALIVDDAAKKEMVRHLKTPPDKEAPAQVKKQWADQRDELARDLAYNAGVRVEIRFDNLDYALIEALQSDELVDRNLTPQTRASIRIVLGTLADFLG